MSKAKLPAMLVDHMSSAQHRAYYEAQLASTAEFWSRFGRKPDVAGKKVLDLGCGHGAMSVQLAELGAEVVGADTDTGRIAFGRDNLRKQHPHLAERVTFEAIDVRDTAWKSEFDLIVSKDTFEHVADLSAMLLSLRSMLRPCGQLWAGFSPLYFSPWGDHGRTGLRLPWAHALLPQSYVIRSAARHQGRAVRSLEDIGLNGLTPTQFRKAVQESGLRFASLLYNRGEKRLLPILTWLRRFEALEKYVTVGVYAVLERPPSQEA